MTIETKRPPSGLKVQQGFQIGDGDGADIRGLIDLAGKNGDQFLAIARDLIRSGELRWEDVDLKGLFLATIDVPCKVRAHYSGLGERTLSTSTFPVLTGLLTAELLERPDDSVAAIYQDLVTMRGTKKDTTHLLRILTGDSSHFGGKQRKEGDPYPLMTASEERVQVDTVDDGRRIAIGAKLLETNDKDGFLEQVNALRKWAIKRRDFVTLHRVFDVYGSGATPAAPYVYRPNGVGTALYTTSTTALARATLGTRVLNNPLVTEQNLQNAIDVLVGTRDEDGNHVGSLETLELLHPHALTAKVDKLLKSEQIPGVPNEHNPFGPNGRYRIVPRTSPRIDQFTTSAWILCRGGFAQQFTMVSRLDMEYVSMAASMEDFLRTRLAFEARIADEFEVGARDHNRAVQSLAGTVAATAPTGPVLGS